MKCSRQLSSLYCNSRYYDGVLQCKMDTIKIEPASDEETDTISSVHDFLQINLKSEYSVAVEAETNEIQVLIASISKKYQP